MTTTPADRERATQLRVDIERAIEAGDSVRAMAAARGYWSAYPNASTARYLSSRREQLASNLQRFEHRVAWLRSFTLEPVVPLLQAEAVLAGCRLDAWIGDFNTYGQEILNPASGLYAFQPDTVVLAVHSAHIAPRLWTRYSGLSDAEVIEEIEAAATTLIGLLQTLRRNTSAHIILHGVERPTDLSEGLLDLRRPIGQGEAFNQINLRLRQACAEQPDSHFLDYDELQARHGRAQWSSQAKWATTKLPFTVDAMVHMAKAWWRYLDPLVRSPAKVLVLDLDNTLWGGVVGEDGLDGLALGEEYPGVFYKSFQRCVLDVAARGVLLAIVSKNNPEDALEALTSHPEMLIRPDAISAMRINWNPKSENLREIAEELNVGLDSLVFVDDNPAECEAVRQALPEVEVLQLPSDPARYAERLRQVTRLERLVLTQDDRRRTQYYADEQERRQAQAGATTVEDFLRGLDVRIDIEPLDQHDIPRAAQLTQKTNQLNVTTRRYTEADLRERLARPEWRGYVVRARDRFGDNGLVGVALTRTEDERCEIDTLLLSCRVIGRGIETAMLHVLWQEGERLGVTTLLGRFIPTRKNMPAAAIFAEAGFTSEPGDDEGQLWSLARPQTVAAPAWVHISSDRTLGR